MFAAAAFGAAEAVCVLSKLEKLPIFKMKVVIYVPGDGHTPMAAAAICTMAPPHWTIYSIDPLMDYV